MKADRKKVELAMARACIPAKDLADAAQLPRPTVRNVITGRNVLPATLGRVARALGCDVTDILLEEA